MNRKLLWFLHSRRSLSASSSSGSLRGGISEIKKERKHTPQGRYFRERVVSTWLFSRAGLLAAKPLDSIEGESLALLASVERAHGPPTNVWRRSSDRWPKGAPVTAPPWCRRRLTPPPYAHCSSRRTLASKCSSGSQGCTLRATHCSPRCASYPLSSARVIVCLQPGRSLA